MEPAEADALNGIIDELINSEADYTAEVEASADFEEQSRSGSRAATRPT